MAVVTDAFTRANENPLASPWATNGTDSGFNLASNAARPVSFGSDAAMLYVGSGIGADQYVQGALTVDTTTGGGRGPGFVARAAAAAQTYYRICLDHAASNNLEVLRVVTGTFVQLLLATTGAWTDSDVWRVEVSGVGATVTLKVFKNGVQNGSDISDTGATRIVTAGNPGMGFSSSVTTATVDLFEAGDLAPAVPGAIVFNRMIG